MSELERIISSLDIVLARGHGLVPVPHKDLRILIETAARRALGQEDAQTSKGKELVGASYDPERIHDGPPGSSVEPPR